MGLLSFVPRGTPLRWSGVVAVVVAAGITAVAPGVAGAQGCPEANPSYMDACGPTFAVPPWGDGGGWTDPSKYSTIQLGDVNGDGRDELLARNDQGLEIWWFDTSVGQWRPQVDANAVPQMLTDFRSPLPSESPATDWTEPQYYSTIRGADVDGQPGDEILGRFSDGMRVYKYSPPAGTRDIDGGSWQAVGTQGPFSDADGYDDPSLYSTIQVASFTAGGQPQLLARRNNQPSDQSVIFYTWNQGGTWSQVPDPGRYRGTVDQFTSADCGQPSCYLTLQTGNIVPGDTDWGGDNTNAIFGHIANGVASYFVGSAFGGWDISDASALIDTASPMFGPFSDVSGTNDCPFTSSTADCLGSSPSYYETMGAANIDGKTGEELLARASDGLRAKYFVPPVPPPPCCGSPAMFDPYATLGALGGAPSAIQPATWGSIRTGDINGDGKDEVLALDAQGLEAWSLDPTADAWSELQPSTPLTLTGEWLTHPEYYSTIRVGDVDGDGHDDVIARGQFGIRTWFYDRRGTGGWERYLADGYPAFPGASMNPQGGRRRRSARSTRSPSSRASSPRARCATSGPG